MKKRFENIASSIKESHRESDNDLRSEDNLSEFSNTKGLKWGKINHFDRENSNHEKELEDQRNRFKNEIVMQKQAQWAEERYNTKVFWALFTVSNVLLLAELMFTILFGQQLVSESRLYIQFVPLVIYIGFEVHHA